MKKAWLKPTIVTYREDELLSKMSLKSQSVVHEDVHEDVHVDSHTDTHGDVADL